MWKLEKRNSDFNELLFDIYRNTSSVINSFNTVLSRYHCFFFNQNKIFQIKY